MFGANLLYRNGLSKHDSGLIMGDLRVELRGRLPGLFFRLVLWNVLEKFPRILLGP